MDLACKEHGIDYQALSSAQIAKLSLKPHPPGCKINIEVMILKRFKSQAESYNDKLCCTAAVTGSSVLLGQLQYRSGCLKDVTTQMHWH